MAQTNSPKREIAITAYLISDLTVRNAEVFQTYRSRAAEAIANYGGGYRARGGEVQTLEGAWNPRDIIIVKFRSMEQVQAWYQSSEYASALEVRHVSLGSR